MTIVQLVEKRMRLEKRALRMIRQWPSGTEVYNLGEALRILDKTIRKAERAARREIKKLAKNEKKR